jgi:protein-disulfide isomerase
MSEAKVEQRRRQLLLQLASAAVFITIAVVAVLVVISLTRSEGGDTELEGVAEVNRDLAGIPQHGLVLGDPAARATVIEFGDLQCPSCKAAVESFVSPLIDAKVRSGAAKLGFRNFTIIDEDSLPAGAAAVAAGEQGRGWNFIELFYRNQGIEHSGYVDDSFLTAIAKGAGVPDIAKWDEDRKSERALDVVRATTAQAEELGLTGTPSFLFKGADSRELQSIDSLEGAETAIQDAQ